MLRGSERGREYGGDGGGDGVTVVVAGETEIKMRKEKNFFLKMLYCHYDSCFVSEGESEGGDGVMVAKYGWEALNKEIRGKQMLRIP